MSVPKYYLLDYCDWLCEQGVRSVVAYGAGVVGRQFLACARECGISVERFVDGNASLDGSIVEGVPVSGLRTAIADRVATYVISSVSHDAEIAARIQSEYRECGLEHPRIYVIPWGRTDGHRLDGTLSWSTERAATNLRTRVSVLIPTVRPGRLLSESIASLVDPSLPGVEYIVGIDRAPVSAVDSLVERFGGTLRVVAGAGSLAATLNKLIEHAKGEYIARADDDDVYYERRLRFQLAYLDHHPSVDVVGGAIDCWKSDRIVSTCYYPETHERASVAALFNNYVVAHPLVMGRKALFSELRYRSVVAEDYDLWIRAMARGYRFTNLALPLCRYRMPSYSDELSVRIRESVRDRICEHLVGYFKFPRDAALEFSEFLSAPEAERVDCERIGRQWRRLRGALEEKSIGVGVLVECVSRYAPSLSSSFAASGGCRD